MCIILDWDGQFGKQASEHRSLIGQRDPQEHARRRRIWSRAFSSDALKGYSTHMFRRVEQLVEEMDRRAESTVDLTNWVSWFA